MQAFMGAAVAPFGAWRRKCTQWRNAAAEAAASAHGVFSGVGGNRDVDRQLEAIELGARFLTTNSDMRFLMSAAADWTGQVRERWPVSARGANT